MQYSIQRLWLAFSCPSYFHLILSLSVGAELVTSECRNPPYCFLFWFQNRILCIGLWSSFPLPLFFVDFTVVLHCHRVIFFFFSRGFFFRCIDSGCHYSSVVSSSSCLCLVLQMRYQWVLHGCSLWDCLCFLPARSALHNLPPIVALNRSTTCGFFSFSRLNLSLGLWFRKFFLNFSFIVTVTKS